MGLGLPIMFVLGMAMATYRYRRRTSVEPQAQLEEYTKEVPSSPAEANGEERANELDTGRTNLELPKDEYCGEIVPFVGLIS
jgi:hypothetical protein